MNGGDAGRGSEARCHHCGRRCDAVDDRIRATPDGDHSTTDGHRDGGEDDPVFKTPRRSATDEMPFGFSWCHSSQLSSGVRGVKRQARTASQPAQAEVRHARRMDAGWD